MIIINMQYFGSSSTSTSGAIRETFPGFYYGENDNGVSVDIIKLDNGTYSVQRHHSPELELQQFNHGQSVEPEILTAETLSEAKNYARGWLKSRKTKDFV